METSTNKIDRRDFIKITGISGAFLALGFLPGCGPNNTTKVQNLNDGDPEGVALNPFIIIDDSGHVTLMSHRPDMGQGTFQAMPMLLAEELGVEMEQVNVMRSNGHPKFGHQDVAGSRSVRSTWEPLRKTGAAARTMLETAAANQWDVKPSQCYAEKGKVHNKKTGESLHFGELVKAASELEAPQNPELTDPEDFKLLGQSLPKPDIPDKINGTATFGTDWEVPGMLYASVARSPVFSGKPKSYDKEAAMAIKGVHDVIETERKVFAQTFYGVAVFADSWWTAEKARKKLNIQWDEGDHKDLSTEKIFNQFRKDAKKGGAIDVDRGDFEDSYNQASKKLEAEYELPFLSHSPMEPMNATVHVKKNACEVWAPTQTPGWVRENLSQYLGIPKENLTINISFIGGGFGRRLHYDFIMEAAYISKKVGKPIKSIWTREDDTTQGPFRPGSVNSLKAGLDDQGKPVAFQHQVTAPSISYQTRPESSDKSKPDPSALSGIDDSPYTFPNFRTRFQLSETPLPIGWWRSVFNSNNVFPHESFIDELAHEAGKDPVQFRLELIQDKPRYTKVLETLADKGGWGKDEGQGVAMCYGYGSICAHLFTVGRDQNNNGLKVKKVFSVIDCGMTINPDNVKAQTEGNVVMGLTAAIKDPIKVENGKVVNDNYDSYRLLTIDEMPEVEVYIMPSADAPGGAGETALPAVAPALTNAVFNVTGKRIRKLPFNMDEV